MEFWQMILIFFGLLYIFSWLQSKKKSKKRKPNSRAEAHQLLRGAIKQATKKKSEDDGLIWMPNGSKFTKAEFDAWLKETQKKESRPKWMDITGDN